MKAMGMKGTSRDGLDRTDGEDRRVKAAVRSVWALGDYHRFATALIWGLGAELVRACDVRAGQDVLDVACGTGNTALRAAAAGARVIACDLTPENFPSGIREADRLGLAVDWMEADAEALPFPDASFDVVCSSVGAMWAPDHRAVADELVRVCRPGGTIGMVTFAAGGLIEDFLAVFDGYAPPPPSWADPPARWGDLAHVGRLFGDRVDTLTWSTGSYVERVAGGPAGYCDFYRQTFGPVVAAYRALADEPERAAELDRRFLRFAERANRGRPGGDAELAFGYVVITARRC